MKTIAVSALVLMMTSLFTACSSAKAKPEPMADPAPVVEQHSEPADLGAASSGRGL